MNAPPARLVLEGIPQPRYLQDGLLPFALCLKCCSDYLGNDYTYRHILGCSGACFRMSWNYRHWDGGNMDLGRLGAEPFRRGLQSVGLKGEFLVKPSWWADRGDDIIVCEDNPQSEALFRQRIIHSIGAGMPILAFGVVGPPEVSIISGYDEGGEVLIGWSCHQGGHPQDQLEPDGQYRKRGWFNDTEGLILLQPDPTFSEADPIPPYAVQWAYEVATLAKTDTHCFGAGAYKGWAEGMLKDFDFPEVDESTLQERRHSVWDGLIMMAERGAAAAYLESLADAGAERPDDLREAARLIREEGEYSANLCKALGDHMLPSGPLADPTARRDAADVILRCRDMYQKALVPLARAAGAEHEVFTWEGPELEDLRPARRWMTLLGCVKGCMEYVDRDVDDAWVYGLSGAAFMLNIDRNVDVSGPTSWNWDQAGDTAFGADSHFVPMLRFLGVELGNSVHGRVTDADFENRQGAAAEFIREKIDAGVPLFGWTGGFPEFITLNGYDRAGLIYFTHYIDSGFARCEWQNFGRNDTDNLSVCSVEPIDIPTDMSPAILAALKFALEQRPSGGPIDPVHEDGVDGYDLWIQCLESGDWLKPDLPGVHHNTACWHECRCYAERFLRLAGEDVGGDLQPRFNEAADHYKQVRRALCQMQTIFVYHYPLPPVSDADLARAIDLLRTARDEEVKGLAVIEQIVAAMEADV